MRVKEPPVASIRSYGLDVDQQIATIELADGSRHTLPFPRYLTTAEAGLKRAVYNTENHEFLVTLPMGDEVLLEMVKPGSASPQPRRPVVYLDQLHWVTLAQQQWAPEKVPKSERAAGQRLRELARERKITFAISSANVTETTQMDGRHRRHLATTMLGLSRGWQMRNPLAIRTRELRALLLGDDPRVGDPFTLDPGAIFIDGLKPVDAPADFPIEWQQLHQNVVAINAFVAAVIEDEKISHAEGMQMAAKWAQSHHELALYMREHHTPKEHVRLNARARLIGDLSSEIQAAASDVGLTQERLTEWLEDELEGDFSRMPYLGRHHEVIHQRLGNADDRWEANDLTDINYLACAAGYADVVVAEKKICEYLNRVEKRVSPGAFVCRKISAAVEHLEIAMSDAEEPKT